MYLPVPPRSQETTATSGDSVEPPCKLALFVQSSAANLALSNEVTPFGRVAV